MNLQEAQSGTGTPQARPGRLVITAERLAEIWPGVRPRLIRRVMAGGVDWDTAEDIAQEVALRALVCGLEYSDADDFCRWGYTVARNLYVDQTRVRARVTTVTEMPDKADGRDVADEVEQRMRLSRTIRAMAELRESDRAAILEGMNSTGCRSSRTVAVRMAVRRHRARTRLLRMVEGLAVAWFWARQAVRTARPDVLVPLSTVAAAAVFVPAVVGIGGYGGGTHLVSPGHAATSPHGGQVVEIERMLPAAEVRIVAPAAPRRRPSAARPPRPAVAPPPEKVTVQAGENGAEAGQRPSRPEDCTINLKGLPAPLPSCVNKPRPEDVLPRD